MGYNGWLAATMGHEPFAKNQTLYYKIADKLVASGLAAAGYDTLLTTCVGWVRDPVTRKLQAPADTWPDGFEALVKYAHAKGLKVGAYTDTGAMGCCHPREVGSLGHEELDVATFVGWGVDHIAVDNCGHPNGTQASVYEYLAFHDALVKVGTPMIFGIWDVGSGKPWAWAPDVGHYWRTGPDLGTRWGGSASGANDRSMSVMLNYDLEQAIPGLSSLSGPGS